MILDEREKEILNVIIDEWDDNGAKMVGNVSYNEVFQLFDKLGLKRPERVTAFIKEVSPS